MIILIINLLINSIRVITLGITDSSAQSAVSNITLTGGKVAVPLGPSLKKHHLNIPYPFNLFIFLILLILSSLFPVSWCSKKLPHMCFCDKMVIFRFVAFSSLWNLSYMEDVLKIGPCFDLDLHAHHPQLWLNLDSWTLWLTFSLSDQCKCWHSKIRTYFLFHNVFSFPL